MLVTQLSTAMFSEPFLQCVINASDYSLLLGHDFTGSPLFVVTRTETERKVAPQTLHSTPKASQPNHSTAPKLEVPSWLAVVHCMSHLLIFAGRRTVKDLTPPSGIRCSNLNTVWDLEIAMRDHLA